MNSDHLKIEPGLASGTQSPGGQHANHVDLGVRVTHLSTGLCVFADVSRSQLANFKICEEMIECGLDLIAWRDGEQTNEKR